MVSIIPLTLNSQAGTDWTVCAMSSKHGLNSLCYMEQAQTGQSMLHRARTDWTVYATSSSRVVTRKLLNRDVSFVLHFIVDPDL
jgi:hypothetical protein